MQRNATLISAPAGFGKTSLICQWQNQTDRTATWLALDDDDNDARQFLSYLIATFESHHPDFGKEISPLLQTPKLPPIRSLMTLFVNELNQLSPEISLVLDDYHFISNPLIHETLDFLLAHLPRNLHLIVSTRADPPLQLMRLRATDQLTEIRAADLRFSLDETAKFLANELEFNLAAEDLALMDERIEGWIAGWQLAAISMRGQTDISEFVRSFAGDDRYVLDYLMEEVFERQPEPVQNFLLQTSILERLYGPLCNAITGQTDGQEKLDYLDAANLFVFALDNKRNWYRYHHLFADLLRVRLNHSERDLIPELHQRAGAWFEKENMPEAALSHYIQAADWQKAMNLLNQLAWTKRYHGPTFSLERWFVAIPKDVLFTDFRLCLFYAEILISLGKVETCKEFLMQLETSWQSDSTGAKSAVLLHVRGSINFIKGNFSETARYAKQVLEKLPEEEREIRASASLALAMAYILLGNVKEVGEAASKALVLNQEIGNMFGIFRGFNILCRQQMMQGKLQDAAAALKNLFQSIKGPFAKQIVLSNAYLAAIYYQWNDLEAAEAYTTAALNAARRTGRRVSLAYAHKIQAELRWARGEPEAAHSELEKALTLLEVQGLHFFPGEIRAYRAWLWLRNGDVEAVNRWIAANKNHLDRPPMLEKEPENLIAARYWIEIGDVEAAEKTLRRCYEEANANGRVDSQIRILLIQALAAEKSNRRDVALERLSKALSFSEPGEYIRLYVDEGRAIENLLTHLLKNTSKVHRGGQPEISLNYLTKILAAFPKSGVKSTKKPEVENTAIPDFYYLDPLSERELEVLQLIREGLSNTEIADKLFISLNTVKTHTKKINQKLNVTSRTQAAARAQQWGLI